MSRIRNALVHLFSLSPEGRAFFYVTFFAHVALKIALGLTLVFEDGYGLRSMLAPPQSIVFAGGDGIMCFLVSKLLDMTVSPQRRRIVARALLVPLFAFLVTSFIVHTYFKAFVNRGLLEFNGAGAVEITDYTISGLTRYSVTFSIVTLLAFLAYGFRYDAFVRSRLVARAFVPAACVFASIGFMIYAGTLSAGQSGWLRKNPGYELIQSYALGHAQATRRASKTEADQFKLPQAPVFGRYDTELSASVPSQRGKNVLFVLIESLPFEQTPLGGQSEGLKVLSELAADGINFTNFRTVFPATSRSFLTYHCGIYPTAGDATVTKYQPDYRCDSILDSLHAAGYRTGFFTAPMFTYDNLHKARVLKGYDVYQDFLTLRARAKKNAIDAPAVEEEAVVDALFDFVDDAKDKPFFATYFMFWNHAPYRLPFRDISSLSAIDRYHITLEYLDTMLRRVVSSLEQRGLAKDTVLIVAADHGEGFGIHHSNVNHVGHIYEDDVHVPFLIHIPGIGRHQTARAACNVDFAPTLTQLLGLPRQPSWQGQDALSSQYQATPTLLFGRASFATNGVVDGQYKYIEYIESNQRLLYDLSVDPHEQQNLADKDAQKAHRYHTLIERWLAAVDYKAWEVTEQR